MNDGIKIGDIFYTSWGYDQTNYNFVVVREISPSGKTAICQCAAIDTVGHTQQCNIQRPKTQGYGDLFRMKIEHRNGESQLRGSYPFCCDGKLSTGKRLGTFWRHKEDKTYYETDSMFGH